MNTQPTGQVNISANHTSGKGLLSRIYKEFTTKTVIITNSLMKKIGKGLKHFSKEDI